MVIDINLAEKILSIFYSFVIGFSAISSISSAVAWTHWKYVLDACPETNCGCFLYGLSTYSLYQGGHIAYCHYVTYSLIIPIIFAIIFVCFHGYRVCMGKSRGKSLTTTVRQRSDEGDVIVVTERSDANRNDISRQYWITTSCIAVLMTIYTLVYASIYTDGFNYSCKEYRNQIIKDFNASGNTVDVVKHRLSCGSVFDFMDYHEDKVRLIYRSDRINTALCFYFAIISSWFNVFSWIIISVVNILSSNRTKQTTV